MKGVYALMSHHTGTRVAMLPAQTSEFTPRMTLDRDIQIATATKGKFRTNVRCRTKGINTSTAAAKAATGIIGCCIDKRQHRVISRPGRLENVRGEKKGGKEGRKCHEPGTARIIACVLARSATSRRSRIFCCRDGHAFPVGVGCYASY